MFSFSFQIGGFSLPFWTLGGILVFFGVISFKLMPTLDSKFIFLFVATVFYSINVYWITNIYIPFTHTHIHTTMYSFCFLLENVKSFTGSRFTLMKHPYSLALCFCIITVASSIAFLDPTLAPQLKTVSCMIHFLI